MSCTIAVTGATGNIGRVLSEILISRGHNVRAIGRDAGRLQPLVDKGAQAHVGSLDDGAFLTGALSGADGAFVMIPPDITSEDQDGRAQAMSKMFVSAIQGSGVKHVVALSSLGAHMESGSGIVSTLRILERELGGLADVNIHFLRPAYFMENVYAQIDLIKNLGFTGGPLRPDVKQPMVATRDIAAMAADRLDQRDFTGHTIECVLGPADISYLDVTAALGKALGRDLSYIQVPDGDIKAGLMQMGMSGNFIDKILELSHAINNGEAQGGHTRTDANTTPTTIDEFAQWFAAAFNG
jgi:uncharacterized protein YbjT (DUF2867 family)